MIVENLIAIAEAGHHDALSAIVGMLGDLYLNGLETRYAKVLKGTPVWELKTRSRGGIKGGARVYWFPLDIGEEEKEEIVAVVVNAEVKAESTPDPRKLAEAVRIHLAFYQNPETMIKRSS